MMGHIETLTPVLITIMLIGLPLILAKSTGRQGRLRTLWGATADIRTFLRVAILSTLLAGRNGPRAMPDGLRRVLLWGLIDVGRQWRTPTGGRERWRAMRVRDGWLDVMGDVNLHGLELKRLPARIRMVSGVLNLGSNRLKNLNDLAGPVRALIVDNNPIHVLDGSVVVESIEAFECHHLREIRNTDGVSVSGLRSLDIARNRAAHERTVLTGVAKANEPGQKSGRRLM